MTDTDKIIAKIKKLLALATSPNEEEAASAAAKAAELLARYNIDREQVDNLADTSTIIEIAVPALYALWRFAIGNAVGNLYFAVHYVDDRDDILIPNNVFVGEPHNAQVAALMFTYLISTVERLSDATVGDGSYRAAFMNGCAARLHGRMQALHQAATHQNNSSTTLPAVYARALARILPLLEGRGLAAKTMGLSDQGNLQGWQDGMTAGEKIGLDQQVTGDSGVRMIEDQPIAGLLR